MKIPIHTKYPRFVKKVSQNGLALFQAISVPIPFNIEKIIPPIISAATKDPSQLGSPLAIEDGFVPG